MSIPASFFQTRASLSFEPERKQACCGHVIHWVRAYQFVATLRTLLAEAPSAGQVLGDALAAVVHCVFTPFPDRRGLYDAQDYGADVIKVEPPGGDTQRYMVSGLLV